MSRDSRVGVVLVHFHTAELARDAVAVYRRCAADEGVDVDIVLVDNGSTPAERAVLDDLDVRYIDPGGNTGYAGGVNRGVDALPDVDVHVVANPDVLIEPGCLTALLDAIRGGAAVAGPCFFWDCPGGWKLPPTEAVGRLEVVRRLLATTRGGRWARRARRRWRRHAQRHWQASRPIETFDLSGALLAVDPRAWAIVGPFDEDYSLYFEETDWLQRARAAKLVSLHVPSARAVHLYAQSTPSEPRAQAWFAASQERFRRRHYGSAFTTWLHAVAARLPDSPSRFDEIAVEPPDSLWPANNSLRWIEMSPSPFGFPAAARHVQTGIGENEPLISPAIWDRLADGDYWLRAIDARGHEVALRRIRRDGRASYAKSPSPIV